jgi:hypothetical protein
LAVPALTESRSQDHCGADAARVSLLEKVTRGIGRDRDDQAIYRHGQISERGIAAISLHFLVSRIEGKDLASETRVLQVEKNSRSAPAALRGTNDGDRSRIE